MKGAVDVYLAGAMSEVVIKAGYGSKFASDAHADGTTFPHFGGSFLTNEKVFQGWIMEGGIFLRGLGGPLRSIKAHHLTEDDLRSLTGDVVVIV